MNDKHLIRLFTLAVVVVVFVICAIQVYGNSSAIHATKVNRQIGRQNHIMLCSVAEHDGIQSPICKDVKPPQQ